MATPSAALFPGAPLSLPVQACCGRRRLLNGLEVAAGISSVLIVSLAAGGCYSVDVDVYSAFSREPG